MKEILIPIVIGAGIMLVVWGGYLALFHKGKSETISLSAEWFGAYPDGSDCTEALQMAISVAEKISKQSNGPTEVLFGPGTYVIEGLVSNVPIRGSGIEQTTLKLSDTEEAHND